MSRSPPQRNSPKRSSNSINQSHDFWKEKLLRESQYVPLSELQSLRMQMHAGQPYLGISKRMRRHVRGGSDLQFYRENMDYLTNNQNFKPNPVNPLENQLDQTNQRYKQSRRVREQDTLQWRQDLEIARQRQNQSEIKDYMQLNPERDVSPVQSGYLNTKAPDQRITNSQYKQFQRNRQIQMESNKDAYKKANQNIYLPQILSKNPSLGYTNEPTDLHNKPRLAAEELKQTGSINILYKVNQRVPRPPDEMFSVLQPNLQKQHDERKYGYIMHLQHNSNSLEKYDSLPANQFPRQYAESRRASLNQDQLRQEVKSKRFSSLGINHS